MTALAATTSPLIRRYTLEEFWALEDPPGGGHYEMGTDNNLYRG